MCAHTDPPQHLNQVNCIHQSPRSDHMGNPGFLGTSHVTQSSVDLVHFEVRRLPQALYQVPQLLFFFLSAGGVISSGTDGALGWMMGVR